VKSVAADSPAAKSGLRAGDRIISLDAQPLVSIADVRWVLHRAPDRGVVTAAIARGGRTEELRIELPAGWRAKSDISGRVGTWQMRGMAFGGLKMDDLDDARRSDLGLAKNAMALRIAHVGQYGLHAAAKNAGFQQNDILVEVGDLKHRLTESELIGQLLQSHRPGDKIPAIVLRGGERVKVSLPQQ
jgi:serine protease Do